MNGDNIPLINFVLYFNPKDCPGLFVIRKFLGAEATAQYHVFECLELAQEHEWVVNMYWIDRLEKDEKQVIGVWI